MTTTSPQGLRSILDLESAGEDTWVGAIDGLRLPQVFGGQLVAQSIMAAARTDESARVVHSIHTSFMRPGAKDEPIHYKVEKLREGRTFSLCSVDAIQGGSLLTRSTVSLVVPREGLEHTRVSPDCAPPSESVDLRDIAAPDGGLGLYWEDLSTVEVRVAPIDETLGMDRSAAPLRNIWMRVSEKLGDDPNLHRAALAYTSDLMLMAVAVAPEGYVTGHEATLARDWIGVSLDHNVWFHRDARADDWLVFEHASPSAAGGRALVEASAFGENRGLAAHVVQEMFMRKQADR